MSAEILCLGEAMVEFTRDGGKDSLNWKQGFGGDTSNAAISAARQGASVGYLTALGDDRFGETLRALWEREKVDMSGIVTLKGQPTGIYFVDPDPAGRFFTYYRKGSAAAQFGPEHLPADLIRAAKVLHLSAITLAVSAPLRAAAFKAMDIARAAGLDVSVDTNLRLGLWPLDEAQRVTKKAIGLARTVVTSIDDCETLFGLTTADEVIDAIQAQGPETVLVTMGAEGCRIAAGDERRNIAPAKADPVDSTGAGDSFAGSFHAWRLETGDPFEAARRAAIVAAGTVSGYGAITPIPAREAVLAAL